LGLVGAVAVDNESQVLHFVGSINGKRCLLLLDTGATHCFVCASFVQQHSLPQQHSTPFVAQTATNQHVAISAIIPAYLAISCVRTPVTLRPLPSMLPHVDVVLGMDSMTANRAVIDVCAGTCTIIVACNPRVLWACHPAASSAPIHEHAKLASSHHIIIIITIVTNIITYSVATSNTNTSGLLCQLQYARLL
jgi:hypothetical protein